MEEVVLLMVNEGRVALISDVHGNVRALEAVLADARSRGVTRFISLGDIATLGPHPRKAIKRTREVATVAIRGNHDHHVLQADLLQPGGGDRNRIRDLISWSAGQLGSSERTYLRGLRGEDTLVLGGVTILCCHGSPRAFDEFMGPGEADEKMAEMLQGVTADVIAAGHTHCPMLRRTGGITVVNPGSVGLASPRWPPGAQAEAAPWAEYGILECSGQGIGVHLRRVAYDWRAHLDDARREGMPHVSWYAASYPE